MTKAAFRPSEEVDFLVIGAGASGGVIAKELASAGFRVVVLEQGPYLSESDYSHDELKYTIMPGLTNDPTVQPITYRKAEQEPAKLKKAIEYGRQVGGGSVHFTANYWRFHESDFHEHSLYGDVAGASLADWPINYQDLEPFYTKAECELGISGLAGANPFEAPRSKPYPLPPMPVKSSGLLFERATRKMGLHPFPAPLAILSQPYRGRAACVHCGFCESFGCEMQAKSSTLVSVIPVAEETGHCEIRPNSYVRNIEINAHGRITGAVYFDQSRKEVLQRAKALVLCANGVESAKLLLLSKSSQFPNGLANSSGLVGKHLMWDLGLLAEGLFEYPANEYKSVQVTRLIHDFYESDPKRGFYGGGAIDARFDFYPAGFALGGLPPGTPKWGLEFKKTFGHYFTRTISLLSHTTSLAVESNTVTLDSEVKDAWGLPAVRITYSPHPDDLAAQAWMMQRQHEILEAMGAKKVWGDPVDSVGTSRHLMGTCRMGKNPAKSVVNSYGRSHDVANLFIVDGSNFVTSARQQPTATIQALAYRAAENMARLAKAGEL